LSYLLRSIPGYRKCTRTLEWPW